MTFSRVLSWTAFTLAALSPAALAQSRDIAAGFEDITAAKLRADLFFLSSDAMEGRMSLQRGDEVAIQWIASEYAKAGLKPLVGDSYLQPVPRNGYKVLEATDGNDAIQIMNRYEGTVHLLLTDVVMRDIGGVELAEYFTRVRPGIPVIYMPGYNEHLWFREDMTVNLIQKPFSATALLRKIRSLLDQPVGLN
jgi:CheY-like chemotaxis protein